MHSDNEMVRLRDVVETLIYMTDEDSDGVEEIMQLPTIDLVRCKECRYKDMEICPMYRLVVAGVRKYDDYCSYGERKESE